MFSRGKQVSGGNIVARDNCNSGQSLSITQAKLYDIRIVFFYV